jgi:hypothetical protein
VNADAVAALADEGAVGTGSLAELAAGLASPRAVWVMVPAAITGRTVEELAEVLDRGDASSTGATPSSATTSPAPRRSPRAASPTSTWARAAACSGSSAASA